VTGSKRHSLAARFSERERRAEKGHHGGRGQTTPPLRNSQTLIGREFTPRAGGSLGRASPLTPEACSQSFFPSRRIWATRRIVSDLPPSSRRFTTGGCAYPRKPTVESAPPSVSETISVRELPSAGVVVLGDDERRRRPGGFAADAESREALSRRDSLRPRDCSRRCGHRRSPRLGGSSPTGVWRLAADRWWVARAAARTPR
jgi:hypothetical protein